MNLDSSRKYPAWNFAQCCQLAYGAIILWDYTAFSTFRQINLAGFKFFSKNRNLRIAFLMKSFVVVWDSSHLRSTNLVSNLLRTMVLDPWDIFLPVLSLKDSLGLYSSSLLSLDCTFSQHCPSSPYQNLHSPTSWCYYPF